MQLMPRYRYSGALVRPIAAGEDPQVKLKDLYKDLGVDPDAPSAPVLALMALARRHVPGFREVLSASQEADKPGRKSAIEKLDNKALGKIDSIWPWLTMESAQLNLAPLVNNACRKMRAPGGRCYTKLEIVTKLSKQKAGPKPGVPNPYFGVKPKTLLSWVTHAGPNSSLRRNMARQRIAAASEFKAFMSQLDSKAKSKDTP
jgi:hypothetical protein